MLSVDFGNTYTKVGLRLGSDAPGQLLKDASLKWDDMNACVPTVAACFESGKGSTWHCGTDVLRFRENTPGLTVYRNWKPRFFDVQGTACGIDELIAEAEALRTVLTEAVGRASHLAAGLKRQRRQGRALQGALASLRELQPHRR
jgi:hypothetical protein